MSREIKGYCNQHFYTDVHPYEVVEVISEKKVIIRAMREIRKTDPIIQPGGFAGHCINNREIECFLLVSADLNVGDKVPVRIVRGNPVQDLNEEMKVIYKKVSGFDTSIKVSKINKKIDTPTNKITAIFEKVKKLSL